MASPVHIVSDGSRAELNFILKKLARMPSVARMSSTSRNQGPRMAATTEQAPGQKTGAAREREWTPRIWEGIDFIAWIRLLARNRFAVGWRYLYIAAIVTFVSFFHMLLRWMQQAWYGQEIKRTPIPDAPVFIIGHWRTGTTLLHELLILDPRHTYPNTYQCLEPNHFLLTEDLVRRWL